MIGKETLARGERFSYLPIITAGTKLGYFADGSDGKRFVCTGLRLVLVSDMTGPARALLPADVGKASRSEFHLSLQSVAKVASSEQVDVRDVVGDDKPSLAENRSIIVYR